MYVYVHVICRRVRGKVILQIAYYGSTKSLQDEGRQSYRLHTTGQPEAISRHKGSQTYRLYIIRPPTYSYHSTTNVIPCLHMRNYRILWGLECLRLFSLDRDECDQVKFTLPKLYYDEFKNYFRRRNSFNVNDLYIFLQMEVFLYYTIILW